VAKTFALNTGADAHRSQEIHGPLLEDTCPHPVDHVIATAILDDDRINAVQMKEMREHQPRRSGADDSYLGSEV
jgi:hypothetical protein